MAETKLKPQALDTNLLQAWTPANEAWAANETGVYIFWTGLAWI